jgi:hypothetical protein
MKKGFWQNLPILRFLSGLWGWITIFLFGLDFFAGHTYKVSVTSASVIYGTMLALYVGSKEYERWQQKNQKYPSKYFGEVYVVIWTLVMIIFVLLAPFSDGLFKIPAEFPAVYLTVVSVFIISRQSKLLKNTRS